MLLPSKELFNGTKVPATTTAEMRVALGELRDYLADLLGEDSTDYGVVEEALQIGDYGHRGLVGSNDAAAPNAKFSITTTSTTYRNAQGGTKTLKSGTTLTVDITVAGPVINGRDQADPFGASAKVSIYKIYNGTTEALIASLAAPSIGPALPSGYTYWSYAGTVTLDGSANLRRMFMAGNAMTYETQLVILAASGAAATQAVSYASYVPTFALQVMIDSYGLVTTSTATTAAHYIRLSSTGGNWKADQVATENAGTGYNDYTNVLTVPNVASQSIYTGWVNNAAVTTVSSTLAVLGFTVPNGAI